MEHVGRRLSPLVPVIVAIGLAAAACGGTASPEGGAPTTGPTSGPTATYQGPAGLAAGAEPQPDGYMWLLARTATAANLQELNLTTGKITAIVPESLSADSVAQSSSGLLGVGLGTSNAGALELRNGASGLLVGTVPVGAPVRAVVAGSDGSTFYVLNTNNSSGSVTVVDSSTERPSITVPVPLGTVSIAVDPSSQNLFALGSDGTVSQITIGTGTVAADFPAGAGAAQLAMSPSGGTLYVLKVLGSTSNIGVVDVQTEEQKRAIGAPAHAVGLQMSPDGRSLYALVGTSTYGNVQVFPSAS